MLLSACTSSTPSAREQLNSGYRDLDRQQYDKAMAASEAFLSKAPQGPGSAEALYLQGRVFEAQANAAGKAGNVDAARAELVSAANAYQRAVELKPPPAVEGLCRAGLANAAYYLDDYGTAVREWAVAYPLLEGDDVRASTLLRVGLCQQRLGWFELADKTFNQLRQEFPTAAGGEPAARAAQRVGHKAFYVQIGVYKDPSNADREIANLKADGINASRGTDPATGGQIVRFGPLPTFGEARALQRQLTSKYKDAIVIP